MCTDTSRRHKLHYNDNQPNVKPADGLVSPPHHLDLLSVTQPPGLEWRPHGVYFCALTLLCNILHSDTASGWCFLRQKYCKTLESTLDAMWNKEIKSFLSIRCFFFDPRWCLWCWNRKWRWKEKINGQMTCLMRDEGEIQGLNKTSSHFGMKMDKSHREWEWRFWPRAGAAALRQGP